MPYLTDVKPMLLDERPLDLAEPGWIYELMYDGYRALAQFGNGMCKMKTRNGADATQWFPELFESLSAVRGGPFVTDGEVCVLDDMGRSDFIRLQDRARRRRWDEGADPVTYCVFDLLSNDGTSLMAKPLLERKAILRRVLTPRPAAVLLVDHWKGEGDKLFGAARALMLEGIVAKRADSPYLPGVRSSAWVKVKRKSAVPAERRFKGAQA